MKIGLDFHGVITSHKEFFQVITQLLVANGHEVHIITGLKKEDLDKEEEYKGIHYTHCFSVTDKLLEQRLYHQIDEHGRPRFGSLYWNTAKARYCDKHNIDIMLDDTEEYARTFNIPFILWERI